MRQPPNRLSMAVANTAVLGFACAIFALPLYDWLGEDRASAVERRCVAQVLATTAKSPLLPEWFHSAPEAVPSRPHSPALDEIYGNTGQLLYVCEVNEAMLRMVCPPGGDWRVVLGANGPTSIMAFAAPGGGPFPGYRYPASLTLPDGLSTNNLGYRGRDLAIRKAERTIRIGFVGASITVDGHQHHSSFPEYVEHWLNLWLQRHSQHVRVEVINAGREAIKSQDLAAIVQHELLPLDLDYVVFHEGANQCGLADMQPHVTLDPTQLATLSPPPKTLALLAAHTDPWLGAAREQSVTLRRLLRACAFGSELPEPEKPAQTIHLPAGLDEFQPDPGAAHSFLQMGQVLTDLAHMQTLCAQSGTRLVITSFPWCSPIGARLATGEIHSLFTHLNVTFWPLRYQTILRLAEVQNRVLLAWAQQQQLAQIDVAASMPRAPQLFTDAYHTTEFGSRLRAWIVTAGLLPLLERDLAAGNLPRAPRGDGQLPPGLAPAHRITVEELNRK